MKTIKQRPALKFESVKSVKGGKVARQFFPNNLGVSVTEIKGSYELDVLRGNKKLWDVIEMGKSTTSMKGLNEFLEEVASR